MNAVEQGTWYRQTADSPVLTQSQGSLLFVCLFLVLCFYKFLPVPTGRTDCSLKRKSGSKWACKAKWRGEKYFWKCKKTRLCHSRLEQLHISFSKCQQSKIKRRGQTRMTKTKQKKNMKNFHFCCDNWVQIENAVMYCFFRSPVVLWQWASQIPMKWFLSRLAGGRWCHRFAILWLEEEWLWEYDRELTHTRANAVVYGILMVHSSTG